MLILTRHSSDEKVIIRVCFCAKAISTAVFIKETLNEVAHKDLLRSNLIHFLKHLSDKDTVFIQDGTAPPIASAMKKLLG